MPGKDREYDGTQAFLDAMPELRQSDTFCFACHPGVACFNACCSDLTMPLAPYDVLRLRRETGQGSEAFISNFARVETYPDTNFPMLYMKMEADPAKRCPFVSAAGCSVYPNRSAACRTYPLGRAARVDGNGLLEERYFVVQEEHCQGFLEQASWSRATWLYDQELEPYNRFGGRYAHLMARAVRQGLLLSPKQVTLCLLGLYELDHFGAFIQGVNLFARLNVPVQEQNTILSDEEARLAFGFDWVELVLFGTSERLKVRTL